MSSENRVRLRDSSGGIVESILGMFSPFTSISRDLQSMFKLDRTVACRAEHGRFEILLRGAGLTDEPLERRLALAHSLGEAARPLLRDEDKRKHRRYAERAISVVFEDEQAVAGGIATSRFSYVAQVERDPEHAYREMARGERDAARRRR